MAATNTKYPGLIAKVLEAVSGVPSQLKSDEDFALVTVTNTINNANDVQQHLNWLVTPPAAPNDVELRSASSMGSWTVNHTIGNIDEIINEEAPPSVSEPDTPAVPSKPAPITKTKSDVVQEKSNKPKRIFFGGFRGRPRPQITQTSINELIGPRPEQTNKNINFVPKGSSGIIDLERLRDENVQSSLDNLTYFRF